MTNLCKWHLIKFKQSSRVARENGTIKWEQLLKFLTKLWKLYLLLIVQLSCPDPAKSSPQPLLSQNEFENK